MSFHMVSKAQSDLAPSHIPGLIPPACWGPSLTWGCRKILWCFWFLPRSLLASLLDLHTFFLCQELLGSTSLSLSTCAPLSEVKMISKRRSNQVCCFQVSRTFPSILTVSGLGPGFQSLTPSSPCMSLSPPFSPLLQLQTLAHTSI